MTTPRASVDWVPDLLDGYWQHTVSLGTDPDGEGENFSTIVRRGQRIETEHAVLAVHGFTDYFFNTELAAHFTAAGFAFYAIDLHKCGRSWRDGQTPHFTTDLARYDVELERALDAIGADTGPSATKILIYGHSAGGLITPLWLDRLRSRQLLGGKQVGGLVLNSPWLDLHGPAILRSAGTVGIRALSSVLKMRLARGTGVGTYGSTLHSDFDGEFDYNLTWKPVEGFPVTFGWINAIRRGHARLHRGLDVGVPNLLLRSDRSVAETDGVQVAHRGDAVLDVTQIARWAGCIGNRTSVVPIPDAKHDVFLSLSEPRARAYRELDSWLGWYAQVMDAAASRKG
ncbi:MAG: alpha/beta hydrolase [Mycobacterium sp.]